MSAKFEIPKELSDQILKLVEDARSGGKIRKGTNEATKSVERNEAKFVVIAADVNPLEIIQHIPMLCDEKKIPYAFVPAKADLGAAAGLPVGTSAIAIVSAGEGAKRMSQIAEQLEVLSGKKSGPAKTEAKAEPAKEKPKEAKPKAPKKAKEEKPAEAVAVTA
ncbi:MAG: 50S ribosomal protein L7ae [DPANN group archaeon]|nr:50S ribosomal protein L7ae [DPANN group archaeon]